MATGHDTWSDIDPAFKGAHRVAALLLVIGKPLADRIIKQLAMSEIRALARSATELPAISLARIGMIVDEFALALEKPAGLVGSSEDTQGLLQGVVSDDEIDDIMSELASKPPKRIWSRLAEVADEKIAAFISRERPQVAVFVLSSLPVEKASGVMEKIDADLRADLSRRLLTMKPISDAAARLVTDRLVHEMFEEIELAERPSNHARLGSILNQLERAQADAILARLEQANPEDATKVRRYLFAFEDLLGLSIEDRGRVCNEIPAERMILALRGTESALRSAILAVLAPRTSRLIEAELAVELKVAPKAIADARRSIAGFALALAEKAEIKLTIDNRPGAAGA